MMDIEENYHLLEKPMIHYGEEIATALRGRLPSRMAWAFR
jgi:hypothetical protein